MRIFGVILAGGAGRRLGAADKAMLPLGGARLIDHAIARLSPQVETLAISANGDALRFADMNLPVLPDEAPLGPLSGILAALDWAAGLGADMVASAAVDTPYFPCDLAARLRLGMELKAGAGVALARAARVHPTFGLWPVSLRGDLAGFLASGVNPKVQDFAASQTVAFADFPSEAEFDNINTLADLDRLQLGAQA